MEGTSKVLAAGAPVAGPIDRVSQLRTAWRQARTAHKDLLQLGIPRVNTLLCGPDDATRYLVEMLLPDLPQPIETWEPAESVELAPAGAAKTLILHDVHALSLAEQRRLLDWIESDAGQTQFVSTTPVRLLPRFATGAFLDTLYYRLNTVFLELGD